MTKCEICGKEIMYEDSEVRCNICGKVMCIPCMRAPRGICVCGDCYKTLEPYFDEISTIETECNARISLVDEKIKRLIKYE